MSTQKLLFSIPGPPRAKGRPRFYAANGFVKSYTPKETANYECLVKLMFVAAKEHQTWELVPKGEPVIMTIVAYFRYPASMSKKQRAITQYVTKKPDGDNIVKITSDALNKLAYEDDSQVAHCEVSKLYTEGAEQVVVTLESEVVKP